MDWVNFRQKAVPFLRQYRYAVLVLLLGLGLMLLPGQKETETAEDAAEVPEETQTAVTLQEELENILSQIEGVGKVQVLLTVASGEQTLYAYDEDSRTDTVQREIVIVTDENRSEQALVQQTLPPVYQGAIVVCQGGDRASVQLAVAAAVASVTGLGTNQITVLKMK